MVRLLHLRQPGHDLSPGSSRREPDAALLSTLATFATGFLVRPFGAIFFGRIGDLVGRKYAFLVTLLIMGGGTAAIGLVPSYETIGMAAPLLLLLRLLQGLALGGEYGGAAIYVAEHVPDHARLLHQLHPGHRHRRPLPLARRDPPRAPGDGGGGLHALGLAHPVPALGPAGRVSLYIRLRLKESPLFTS